MDGRVGVDITLVSTRDRRCITSSNSNSRKQSAVVAAEILNNIGCFDGINYISYPLNGAWKIDTLQFLENKITKMIIKRPETSFFPIFARFSDDHLTGEIICELSNGSPAITIDNHILRFGFDPFAMYIASLNDGFRSSRINALKQSVLMMYWHMPPIVRKGVSKFSRRYEMANVRCLGDLGLLGICNNVIVHLIEQHLRDIGLLRKKAMPTLAAITHDIDTDYCQKEGREQVTSIENEENVKSTWFFVPKSVQYTLYRKGVMSLISEGHEIGMHGYTHGGRLALYDARKLAVQLRKGREILESIGTSVQSFRSPYTLRSPILLSTLAAQGFKIDSSYTDAGTIGIAGGLKGLSYNRPFRPLIHENSSFSKILPLWEAPITCPQDVHLIDSFKATNEQLFQVWKYKADFCKDFGGFLVLLTHPVHIVKRIEAFKLFLRYLTAKEFRFVTMNYLPHSIGKSNYPNRQENC